MSFQAKIDASLDKIRALLGYWVERAKFDFIEEVGTAMEIANISKADLARATDSSNAYISKVMRGNQNLTLETMVKLARASKAKVQIKVISDLVAVGYADIEVGPKAHSSVIPFSQRYVVSPIELPSASETSPANDANFALAA